MRQLVLVIVVAILSHSAQAQELWVSFGVTTGRPDHTLHVKADGMVEGRKYGDGYTLDIGAKGANSFLQTLKRKGLLNLPKQFSYDHGDCLSFLLNYHEGSKKVEVSGGDAKNSKVKAVYDESWALFERLVREGKPRR